jgi:hypothetical protein
VEDHVSKKTGRVMPSSRQPVTSEHHASAVAASEIPADSRDETGEEVTTATNPVWPVTTAAAASDTDEPVRTATFEDAKRFAGAPITTPAPAAAGHGGAAASGESDRTGTPAAAAGPPASGAAKPTGGTAPPPAGTAPPPAGFVGTPAPAAAAWTTSQPGSAASSAAARGARNPDQLERDIEATRARLAGTIDEINDRLKPANVAERAKARARAQVVDSSGQVRMERVGPAAAAVVVLVALVVWRRLRSQ